MKSYRANPTTVLSFLLTLAASALLPHVSLRAQSAPALPPVNSPKTATGGRERIDNGDPRTRFFRTLASRTGEDENVNSPAVERQLAANRQQEIIQQIKKDYRLIQQLNNEVLTTFTRTAPDYKLIARHSGEINERASRLRQHLALPQLDEADLKQKSYVLPDTGEIRPALNLLARRIQSFVNNPLFRNPNVVDVDLSTKASHDLQDIIELSQNVRKHAERLHKSFYGSQ